jgi:dipeptidyl aminopeptidase/acylaminoacyl peptidase
VIQYRHNSRNVQTTIYRIDINQNNNLLSVIRNVSFLIGELLFVPLQAKLVCTSISLLFENIHDFEIYSIDLWNTSSSLVRLTDNEALEEALRLSTDGQHVLFRTHSVGSTRGKSNDTQARLFSLNLINGQIRRLAENFHGHINEFVVRPDGGVLIVGQLGTETQIYSQRSSRDDLIKHSGWNGTYASMTSSYQNRLIAFVHSSTENPMEVYFINSIDQLQLAQAITTENKLFTQ